MPTLWDSIPSNTGGAAFDWENPNDGLESTVAFEHMKLVCNDRAKCFDSVDPIEDGALEFTNQSHIGKFQDIQGKLTELLKASADFSLFSDTVGSISALNHIATYDNYQGINDGSWSVRTNDEMWNYVGTLLSEDLTFWRDITPYAGKYLDKDLLRQFYLIVGRIKYAVFFQDSNFNSQSNRGLVRGTSAMIFKSWWGDYYHQLNYIDSCELSENPSFASMYAEYPAAPTYSTTTVTMASWCERDAFVEVFPGPQGFSCQYQGYSRSGDAKALLPTALSGLTVSTFNRMSDYGSYGFEGFGIVDEGFNTMPSSTGGNVITVTIPQNDGSAFYQFDCLEDLGDLGGSENHWVSYYSAAWAFVGQIDDVAYLDYYTP